MARARRHRLELGRRAAVLQEGRARHGLRRSVARQRRPHPGAAHLSRSVAGTRQGGGRDLQGGRLQIPDRPERRIRGRLFPDHHLQRVRAAGVGGDRLSRSRHAHAREPDDFDRHAGQHAAVRRAALRRREGAGGRARDGIPRPRGHPVVGRDPLAGASAARRHRAGGASARPGHRGARRAAGRGPAAAGPSGGRGGGVHQAASRGSSTTTRGGTSTWRCAIRRSWTAFRPATCSPW